MRKTVELRCPVGPRRLLAKLQVQGEKPSYTSDNLMELACSDCKRALRQKGVQVSVVVHRFNILGELIESETLEYTPGD